MRDQIEFWLSSICELEPRANRSQLTRAANLLSQQAGINEESVLGSLYQDLMCGIPFRQTAAGKVMGQEEIRSGENE